MTVRDVLAAKKQCEDRIATEITEAIRMFQVATGLGLDTVYIDFMDTTAVDSPRKTFALGRVELKINLDDC